MRVIQSIGAAIAGALAGGCCVALIEGISSIVYPMPTGLDISDREGMANFVSSLPIGAFLFVLLAWAVGLLVAGYVARRIAPRRSLIPAFIACGLLFLGAVFTMATIPHPVWFWFAGIGVCLLFGLIGILLASPASCRVEVSRKVNAPLPTVFRTLAQIEEFSKAVPGIESVEFLTDQHYGVGTKFRETRLMHGKSATTELEVTELVENDHIRLVAIAGGTLWDTVFKVKQLTDGVDVNMRMDARPCNLMARAINPLIIGMVSKAVEQDMDSVKLYCEQLSK